MTTGLLIGIGETRRERIESLLALRAVQDTHGHLQELIIQNFKAKPGTKMAAAARARARRAALDDRRWRACCSARTCRFKRRPTCSPKGSQPGARRHQRLGRRVAGHARSREPRSTLAASYRSRARHRRRRAKSTRATGPGARLCGAAGGWTDPAITPRVRRFSDSRGFARPDRWYAGLPAANCRRSRRAGHRPPTCARSLRPRLRTPKCRTLARRRPLQRCSAAIAPRNSGDHRGGHRRACAHRSRHRSPLQCRRPRSR